MSFSLWDLKRILPGVLAVVLILGTTAVLLFLSMDDDRPPQAVISMSSQIVVAGDPVFFDGSGSSDPDGDDLEYQWIVNETVFVYEPKFHYAFPIKGNITVVLRVTDPSGKFDTETVFVDVR